MTRRDLGKIAAGTGLLLQTRAADVGAVDPRELDPVLFTHKLSDATPLRLTFQAKSRAEAEKWQKDLRAKLVELLGGSDLAERDAAYKALSELGSKASDALRVGIKSDNLEIAKKSKELLAALSPVGPPSAHWHLRTKLRSRNSTASDPTQVRPDGCCGTPRMVRTAGQPPATTTRVSTSLPPESPSSRR